MFSFDHLQDFHFLRPEWLIGLIPLLLLYLVLNYFVRQQSGWQSVIANHLTKHLLTSEYTKQHRPPLYLLALGWIIAVISLAGPAWEKLPQPVFQLNEGKIIVLDLSLSMRSTDLVPDRLTRAKFKIIDLVKLIGEGETGLVAYAGDAFTISPLTTDVQNLTTLIPSLTPEIMPVPGSDPTLALQQAISLLANAGYTEGEIFLITDGVDSDQMQEVLSIVNRSNYRVSVLGVGTKDGAPIKQTNGELLKDSRGGIIIPQLPERNLSNIARQGNGRYVTIQSTDQDINYLVSQEVLNREASNIDESDDNFGDEWKEMGHYLILILLPFAAYAFRKGVVLIFVIGLLPIDAARAESVWWKSIFQTQDQQGQKLFEEQNYADAAQTFEDPLRAGSAHFRGEDYGSALDQFSRSQDPESLYNAGNALAHLGQIDEAIAVYEEVLKQVPDHADAIANKALLEQAKEEQEQQEQEQDQQQEQNQDQNSDQQQDQNDQDQQNADQQNSDQQNQSESGSENQDQSAEQSDQESESDEQESEEEQGQEDQREGSESEGEGQQQAAEAELTEEEKEQMQRLETLLRKVPDDPAFLLKRKMQLEYQNRRRSGPPSSRKKQW